MNEMRYVVKNEYCTAIMDRSDKQRRFEMDEEKSQSSERKERDIQQL